MNYEKNYCEMKNRLYSAVKESADVLLWMTREERINTEMRNHLYSAVKESADVLLWMIREERINTAEFEIATACYNALYEQITRNQLEDDYDTWEWSIGDVEE